jgi:DNA processing protein
MSPNLPDEAYAAALAGLPKLGPRRLSLLLSHHRVDDAFRVAVGSATPHPAVATQLSPDLVAEWAAAAARCPPSEAWERCERAGVQVLVRESHGYPPMLLHDPDPPAVLFARGDIDVLAQRRVGVVGTRNATRVGLDIARALGVGLASAGVAVVSGLARGIDGAAHRGALAASGRPVAVVGNGPDIPYPAAHRSLWAEVCEQGLLVSEWPPGIGPDSFRFPLRNRILAALCEVLVVVESRERGGSLITAQAALDRSVEVMAVPGSPRSRAAAGTNALIGDGAAPVTCTDDVLMALGLDTRRKGQVAFDPRPMPRGVEAEVLRLCQTNARTLDDVVRTLAIPVADAAMAIARLERAGWLFEAGGWFEPIGTWPASAPADQASWSDRS